MVSLRPVNADDIQTLAQIHIEGWNGAYGGLVDNEFLSVPTIEERSAQWQEWIDVPESGAALAVNDDGSAAGFVSYGKLKTPPPGSSPIRPLYSSEIYGLYLLPDYYRQGIGTMLIKHAAAQLMALRHKSMCLWVLEKNSRAVPFYKKMGGERCGKHMIELGQTKVKEICFGWRDLSILV